MNITSPDITSLDFAVLLDISSATPSATLSSLSTVINPSALAWVFEVYSPSGTPIHKGDFSAPDVLGNWITPFVVNTNFPKPFNQIEWSGSSYTVVVKVKDANGNIYELTKSIRVCPPSGVTKDSKNTYGTADVFILTRCREAQLFFEDRTNYSYQGKQGTPVTKKLTVLFPPDETGIAPQPYVFDNFNSALIPITQSGTGYQYYLSSVVDYSFGDGVTVRIKYLKNAPFPVYCNIDLTPVACELNKLLDDYQNGNCAEMEQAEKTIKIVTAKLQLINLAVLYPQIEAIDPYKTLQEINDLAGWECDCCSSGVVPLSAIAQNGTLYQVVSDGGDIKGWVEPKGDTILFHLSDFTYVFAMGSSASKAFTIVPNIANKTKTYYLNVDAGAFTDEVLTVIEGNTTYKNRLNNLVVANIGSGVINVNPKCILPQTKSYDYTFTATGVVTGKTYTVQQITVDGKTRFINFLFDRTNSADLQIALNNLGIGVFVASFSGSTLTITSNGNTAEITSFIGQLSGAAAGELTIQKTTTDISTYSISTVMQGLIDFVCSTIISRISVGRGYSINWLKVYGQAIQTITVAATDTTDSLFDKFITAYNDLVTVVSNMKGVDCTNIKALFTALTGTVGDEALFYGSFGTQCVSVSAEQLAVKIFRMSQSSAAVKTELCAAISACGKTVCNPVTNAVASYNAGTQTLSVEITNTGALQYRVGYRSYRSISPLSGVQVVSSASGTTTTATWTSVPVGAYDVVITAICANGESSSEYKTSTALCDKLTALNVSASNSVFTVTWGGVPANAEKVRIVIEYPNGGGTSIDYATTATPATINIPGGVYGDYKFSGYSVCSVANNWLSLPYGPVIANVPTPDSCPAVNDVRVLNVTETSATITAAKPANAGNATLYRLTLTPQMTGVPLILTTNSISDTLTWDVSGLNSSATYSVSITTACTNGESRPYDGGTFITKAVGSTSESSVTNTGANSSTYITVVVNNVIVYSKAPFAGSEVGDFSVAGFGNVNAYEVRVTPCNGNATTAQITNGATTYSSFTKVGDTFIFNNVRLTGGIDITYE